MIALSVMSSSHLPSLVSANRSLLEQVSELLDGLPEALYTQSFPPASPSAVGAHLRHVLDHYDAICHGAGHGRIDYYERQRDSKTEQDPATALARIADTLERLDSLGPLEPLDVRISVEDPSAVIPTTLERELHFALSHTVHHLALIASALRLAGHPTPEGFGVAPSTLAHWRKTGVAR